MELLLRAIFGAVIVLLISFVTQTRLFFLAGLIPLFPTFALISDFIVSKNGPDALQKTAQFGMLSLIPYFCYLFMVFFLAHKLPIVWNLLVSVLVWVLFASLIFWFWNKLH